MDEYHFDPKETFLLTQIQQKAMLEKLFNLEKEYHNLTTAGKIKYPSFYNWIRAWGDLEMHEEDFVEQCYGE
jgi:hypothetical protein